MNVASPSFDLSRRRILLLMVTSIDLEIYFYTIDLGSNLWDHTQKKILTDHVADQRLRIILAYNYQFD